MAFRHRPMQFWSSSSNSAATWRLIETACPKENKLQSNPKQTVIRDTQTLGLTPQSRQQGPFFLVVAFVTFTEIQQQEDIHKHPHQRRGKNHFAVDKSPHSLCSCQHTAVEPRTVTMPYPNQSSQHEHKVENMPLKIKRGEWNQQVSSLIHKKLPIFTILKRQILYYPFLLLYLTLRIRSRNRPTFFNRKVQNNHKTSILSMATLRLSIFRLCIFLLQAPRLVNKYLQSYAGLECSE